MVPHPQDYEILKYSGNMWVNRELCPWPPSTQERNTHRMKRVAPSAHMSAVILPSPPIKTSGAGGEREGEGGREGKEGEYEGSDNVCLTEVPWCSAAHLGSESSPQKTSQSSI